MNHERPTRMISLVEAPVDFVLVTVLEGKRDALPAKLSNRQSDGRYPPIQTTLELCPSV